MSGLHCQLCIFYVPHACYEMFVKSLLLAINYAVVILKVNESPCKCVFIYILCLTVIPWDLYDMFIVQMSERRSLGPLYNDRKK